MRLANLPIAAKLTAAFCVLVTVVVVFSTVVYFNLQSIKASDASKEHVVKVLAAANQVEIAVIEQVAAMRGYLLKAGRSPSPATLRRWSRRGRSTTGETVSKRSPTSATRSTASSRRRTMS